ncbi:MAG: gamma carbonic anhydrase family protein [Gammaproteobacteria bacterium]|nr:MAG: gamma carbonic anhydrase family protein [Gammaproteobacteria bacterium]
MIDIQNIKPIIHKTAMVLPSAVLIGDCKIDENSSIWANTTLRADLGKISVGKNSNIQDGSTLHMSHQSDYSNATDCIVGDYVTVGHNVILHGCTIKDESLIGMGSIILDGAIVEKNTMVGAGSLVPNNKILESGFLYLGSPAKKIRKLTAKEISFFRYSAEHYVKLSASYKTK